MPSSAPSSCFLSLTAAELVLELADSQAPPLVSSSLMSLLPSETTESGEPCASPGGDGAAAAASGCAGVLAGVFWYGHRGIPSLRHADLKAVSERSWQGRWGQTRRQSDAQEHTMRAAASSCRKWKRLVMSCRVAVTPGLDLET
eukprot:394129-Hanusia_phi.AAC.1